MDQAEAALAAILETVNATKDVLVTCSTPASLLSQLPSCRVQSAVNNSIQSRPVADIVAGNSDTAYSGNPQQNNVRKSIVPSYNWASAAEATSSPVASSNRFAILRRALVAMTITK